MYSIRDPNEYNGLCLNRIYNNCWTLYHTVICFIGFWSRQALAFYSVGNLGGRLLGCLRCLTDDPPKAGKCCGDKQRDWCQTDSVSFVNLFKPQFFIHRGETVRNSIYPRELLQRLWERMDTKPLSQWLKLWEDCYTDTHKIGKKLPNLK